MPLDPSGPRPRRGLFFLISVLVVVAAVFLLILFPNPLVDSVASRIFSKKIGRPVGLHRIRVDIAAGSPAVFRVGETDLRRVWPLEETAVGRFVRQHGLSSWLVVKDSRWAFKVRRDTSYLRLLEARAGDVLIQGGLRFDGGRISKWNAAFRLPRSLWERFPELVGKRFGQDSSGRRLFKLTWSGGHCRLWGRSGPVLEASWQ